MASIRKFALGLGLASGAVLTAWLLTGDRKVKTKDYFVRRTDDLRNSLKTKRHVFDDSEAHYI